MTIGPDLAGAVTAFNRFGFGARPGDLAAAAGDPRGFLLEELWTANVALIRDRPPPSGPAALQAYYLDQQRKRAERMSMATAPPKAPPPVVPSMAPLGPAPPEGPSMTPMAAGQSGAPREATPESPKPQPQVEQALFRAEAVARLQKQLQARLGLVERLVAFWSNHFAVSVAKSAELRAAAGPFEREAIRPNVLGKFAALLRAAESHPAMILYLDNQNSVGPNAPSGLFAGKGLNENLAREILELHTLGVGSGYTQADVTEFARILTGWSVAGPESEVGATGSFLFKANWHEPGQRTLLGKKYPEVGLEQGYAALDDLARHPATARHIATKLVRHFVADVPPPALVDRLASRFLDTDGDLKEVARALVSAPEAWAPERAKIKRPSEWIVAA